jgi:hypothetical protein
MEIILYESICKHGKKLLPLDFITDNRVMCRRCKINCIFSFAQGCLSLNNLTLVYYTISDEVPVFSTSNTYMIYSRAPANEDRIAS